MAQAKTGIERYRILLTTHKLALEKGLTVDYTGIKELDIEIPIDGCSIPLGYNTDFKGLILNVNEIKRKNIYLFKMKPELDSYFYFKTGILFFKLFASGRV